MMEPYTANSLWQELQQQVLERRPSFGGPMQNGKALILDEYKLVVGFSVHDKFSLEYLIDEEHLSVINDIARKLLKRPFQITLELFTNEQISVGNKSIPAPEPESRLQNDTGKLEMRDAAVEIHRTWVELLMVKGYPELGVLVLDAELIKTYDEEEAEGYWQGSSRWAGFIVSLPPQSYEIIMSSTSLQEDLRKSLAYLTRGHIFKDEISVSVRIKFMEVEANWKEKVRTIIAEYREANQGIVTDILARRDNREPIVYNEMKFASRAEVRIAQELESRRVLFFPLPLAVRSDTGAQYLDHREPDFLICQDGAWGILEVSFHQPERYEKDSEKDLWFKQSGILCIQHFTAESCFNNPAGIVDRFLEILAKYKK